MPNSEESTILGAIISRNFYEITTNNSVVHELLFIMVIKENGIVCPAEFLLTIMSMKDIAHA